MGVSNSLYIGVTGLNSFGTAMSVVGDNVANANTTAFKSSTVRFGDMVSSYYGTMSNELEREGAGSGILGIDTNFAQGPTVTTSSWSDLAIQGNGFFNVQDPVSGKIFYTRDGNFHVDKQGYLVNNQGLQVLDSGGAPIQVEPNPATPLYSSYSVDSFGQISGTPVAGGDPVPIGAPIRITTFPNQGGLVRNGANLYSVSSESGAAVDGSANVGPCGPLIDYALEGSNVDLAKEMVNMIIYQADYNANSKTITTSSNMLETVVNMVR